MRADLTPTLWAPDPKLTQVLFSGAHGDVGGGYPTTNTESGLSDLTLDRMAGLLAARGVLFAPTPAFRPAPNPCGCAHQP